MKRSKINSISFLRAICITGIVLEHCQKLFEGYEKKFVFLTRLNFLENYSMGFGTVGVAVFFMISGAVLIYNHNNEDFHVGEFYLTRFLRMCPIIYCLHFLVWLVNAVIAGNYDWSFSWKHLGQILIGQALVGEWFTTVILFCYLMFPILRVLYNKQRIAATIIILILMIADWKYQYLVMNGSEWFSFGNALFEFWFGMLVVNCRYQIKRWMQMILLWIMAAVPLWSMVFAGSRITYYVPTLIFAGCLFLLILPCNLETKWTQKISECSYEIYLIHHQVLYILFPIFYDKMRTQSQYFLFLCFVLFFVYVLSDKIHELMRYITMKTTKRIRCSKVKQGVV